MDRALADPSTRRTRGVALISAMLIAAIVAATSVAISTRLHIEIRRTSNIADAERARELLRNVEYAAFEALRLDIGRSQFDDLSEDWSTNPLDTSNAFGDVSGSIEDLQGRFNLANLAPSYHGASRVTKDTRSTGSAVKEAGEHSESGPTAPGSGSDYTNASAEISQLLEASLEHPTDSAYGVPRHTQGAPDQTASTSDRTAEPDATSTRQRIAEMRFRPPLNVLDIDAAIVQAILDWTDADSETRFPNGAEDDYYLGLAEPYRAANRPLASVRELLLVRGVTTDIFERLEPFVIALSEPTPINVNTAPEEVLMSLAPGIDHALAAMLTHVRETQPFTNVQSFTSHPLLLGRPLNGTDLAIYSNWFGLKAITRAETLRFQSSTTLYRNGNRVGVVGRRHGYFDD